MPDHPNLRTSEPEGAVDQHTDIDYKSKLDKVAEDSRRTARDSSAPTSTSTVETVVETIAEYIPPVKKMLGKAEPEQQNEAPRVAKGPPERPHHDTQIEEFVRDQHRSKDGNGLM